MSVATDPALYGSNYERMENERYWTEPWVTEALLRRLGPRYGPVWEPACGRGDMVRVLMNHGLDVLASDVDMSEFSEEEHGCAAWKHDFLRDDPLFLVPPMVITNPPYGGGDRHLSEKFVHRALNFEEVRVVAMLLRSEFKSAGRREAMTKSEGTHAYLPANKVARACADTINDIQFARRDIIRDVVDKFRSRGPWLPRRSEERAKRLLMPEHHKAAELHREDDERVASNLMGFSLAAAEGSPDFRIYVSLEDFRAIAARYGARNCP